MFHVDQTDQELMETVVRFYRHRFEDHSKAQKYLLSRSLTDPELIKTFEIGFADRELGRSLPKPTIKRGREIRNQLEQIGIFRKSGHGHFNGCITMPLRTIEGTTANLYGRKISRNLRTNTELHMTIPEEYQLEPGKHGIFNTRMLQTTDEVILTDSIINAMSSSMPCRSGRLEFKMSPARWQA